VSRIWDFIDTVRGSILGRAGFNLTVNKDKDASLKMQLLQEVQIEIKD